MLLAIDTSTGTSVAVVGPQEGANLGAVLAEETEPDTRRHAEVVGVLISRVLRSAGIGPGDLDAVVAGMGPGPFTGLRVGIATARAFAVGIGRPLLPVVSHDAVAFGCTRPTLVVTDARRREVAWSTYRPAGPDPTASDPAAFDPSADTTGIPVRMSGPELARPEDLETAVPGYREFERVDAAQISAGSLGLLAARLRAAGRASGPAEPLYLRAPDVTIATAPKRVTG